jgi:uncharacterized membrane protein YjfL (UPF0719 family)
MEDVLIAISRKLIFAVMVVGGLILFDKFYLTGFDTWEVIKDDPKAVSLFLGLLALSISFA